jgi:organic radical activating enzyme
MGDMQSALVLAQSLLAEGIEVHVRKNNTLWCWPKAKFAQLPEATRNEVHRLRHQLKVLVRDGQAPRLPTDEVAERQSSAPPPIPEASHDASGPVWTHDYSRRITPSDVAAVGLAGHSQEVYERTRDLLRDRDLQLQRQEATRVLLTPMPRRYP